MKIRSSFYALAIACCICGWLTGCGFKKSLTDADKFMDGHFKAVRAKDFETVLGEYSSDFYAKTPRLKWSTMLSGVYEKLGDLQSYKVVKFNVLNRLGSRAGTCVVLIYRVTYSKSEAQEDFTLFRAENETEFKISGHFIHSNALAKQ